MSVKRYRSIYSDANVVKFSENLNISENCRIFAVGQKYFFDMARPIKETPILYGDDARRFLERMKNPPKVSPEKRAEIRKSYETVMKMMVK